MQRRTALISAASIAAAILSGATAVGANIGILSSANDDPIGNLSAATSVGQSEPQSSATPIAADQGTHTFAVEAAGTVAIDWSGSVFRLADVTTNPGWTTSINHVSDTVMVTFDSADSRLEFIASRRPDGTVDVRVDQPIVTPSTATPMASAQPTAGPSTTDDDDHEPEDLDDDHGYEAPEREGAGDDD